MSFTPRISSGLGPIVKPLASDYTVAGTGLWISQDSDVVRAVSNSTLVGNVAVKSGSLSSSGTWIVNLTANFLPDFSQYPGIGLVVATGNTTSATGYVFESWWNNGTAGLHSFQCTVGTQTRSALAEITNTNYALTPLRLRMLADGSKLHYQFSADGHHWRSWWGVGSELTIPSSLTHYGFEMGCAFAATSGSVFATILSNNLTALNVAQSTVTNATNATPIVITTSGAHNLVSGDRAIIRSVGGNTNANTVAYVNVLTSTTFQMLSIAGNGSYTSGGIVTCLTR